MSFILEAAARHGCDFPERPVTGGVGSVNESAPKPSNLGASIGESVEAVGKGIVFGTVVNAPPLTEASLKRAIDGISREYERRFIFGESHERIVPPETPLECAKTGLYRITRRYKELDLYEISTPAGTYTISGHTLYHDCPEPAGAVTFNAKEEFSEL